MILVCAVGFRRFKFALTMTGIIFPAYTFSSMECHGKVPKYQTNDPYGNIACQPCSKCPPGTGVSRDCDNERDTQCEICPEGTYSTSWSRTSVCQPCTTCPPHRETVRSCNKTINSKCAKKCDHGFFLNQLTDMCDKCSWCFPDSSEYTPPRVPECVLQELPIDYQCMPVRHDTVIPSLSSLQDQLFLQDIEHHQANSVVAVNTDRQDITMSLENSTAMYSTKNVKLNLTNTSGNKDHMHDIKKTAVIVTAVIVTAVTVVLVSVKVSLLWYVRHKKKHKNDIFSQEFVTLKDSLLHSSTEFYT
ncbi:uncharacterized protein LOC144439211 [Glandiceps talaboti]